MTKGRAYLVAKLRERGLSKRDAVRILNQVFSLMKAALRRGEDVESPFGFLRVDRHRHRPKRGWQLNQTITTTYKKPFTVVLHEEGESGKLQG